MHDDVTTGTVSRRRLRSLARPAQSGFEQMIRFGLVGAVATVADVGVLWVFAKVLKMHYLYAAIFGYGAGIVVSYTLSVIWVFSHRAVSDRRLEFAIFAAIGVVALGLTEAVLYVCIEYLHMELMIAKAVSIVTVFAFNFGARKATIFRSAKPSSETATASVVED